MATLIDATMIVACKEGDTEAVSELLAQDPECCHRCISWTDKEQNDLDTPPIFIAVDNNHMEVVKILLGVKNADINILDANDYTPLQWASWSGKEDMVKLLIEKGARVDQEALDLAKEFKQYHIVELLQKNVAHSYAELDGDIDEIMIKASRVGDLEKVKELIADGYDFSKWKDEDGSYQEYSPIYVAMKNGHVEVIGEFMAAGVEAELHSTHFHCPEEDLPKVPPAELSEEQIAEITKAMLEEEENEKRQQETAGNDNDQEPKTS